MTAATLAYELADIERKLKACQKPVEWRTAADKRYFSRLLAAYKRLKQKLRALEAQA